jgi:molybdate transport system regulatory protein
MNRLKGEIISINSEGNLSLVAISYGGITLKSIIIEKPGTAPYLKSGHPVNILFKETEVVIGKNIDHPISIQNRIPCTVSFIERGKLLSKVAMKSSSDEIISVISTHAVDQLALQKGDAVLAMIKTNEIMLSE